MIKHFGQRAGHLSNYRRSRPEVFCKTGVFRNFGKFTGKHPCQRLSFHKVAGLLQNFWEHLFLQNTSGGCFFNWQKFTGLRQLQIKIDKKNEPAHFEIASLLLLYGKTCSYLPINFWPYQTLTGNWPVWKRKWKTIEKQLSQIVFNLIA